MIVDRYRYYDYYRQSPLLSVIDEDLIPCDSGEDLAYQSTLTVYNVSLYAYINIVKC